MDQIKKTKIEISLLAKKYLVKILGFLEYQKEIK